MALSTVTAGCGHTVTQQFYGPGKERARRIAWMESPGGMCHPCYAAHKREQEAREYEQAVDGWMVKIRAMPRPSEADIAAVKVQLEARGIGGAREEAMRRYIAEREAEVAI